METPISRPFDLLLASKSPRRRQLLEQIGVRFDLVAVDVPERPHSGELPLAYVERLANSKARAGAEKISGYPVLGADTIVVFAGQILEKPLNFDHARSMLSLLSASVHTVMTAVSLCAGARQQTLVNTTEVEFGSISAPDIEQYWRSGEPCDKAGAYAIQGWAGAFVKSIRGSYSAVVGLPLFETQLLLNQFGVPYWRDNKNYE